MAEALLPVDDNEEPGRQTESGDRHAGGKVAEDGDSTGDVAERTAAGTAQEASALFAANSTCAVVTESADSESAHSYY